MIDKQVVLAGIGLDFEWFDDDRIAVILREETDNGVVSIPKGTIDSSVGDVMGPCVQAAVGAKTHRRRTPRVLSQLERRGRVPHDVRLETRRLNFW